MHVCVYVCVCVCLCVCVCACVCRRDLRQDGDARGTKRGAEAQGSSGKVPKLPQHCMQPSQRLQDYIKRGLITADQIPLVKRGRLAGSYDPGGRVVQGGSSGKAPPASPEEIMKEAPPSFFAVRSGTGVCMSASSSASHLSGVTQRLNMRPA